MKILVTGSAGFIGYHLCEALLKKGHSVVGIDNINDYYDVNLKYSRLKNLGFSRKNAEKFNALIYSVIHKSQMQFIRMNLENRELLPKIFKSHQFDFVCNLAAQAGVRYSLENPEAYIDSNINGFLNILECCRHNKIIRLVYASSSSVYGNSNNVPFTEIDNVDKPISLYAATKKSNELMAHAYSHLYKIETIGLRFFTVYGPWGRPDMAYFLFIDSILKNKPIKIFNNGNLSRDFTYIDDIIKGVLETLLVDATNPELYKLYNIGNSKPVNLLNFIEIIEKSVNKISKKIFMPMQPGDVNQTWADISGIEKLGYKSTTRIEEGIRNFVEWFKYYYKI